MVKREEIGESVGEMMSEKMRLRAASVGESAREAGEVGRSRG